MKDLESYEPGTCFISSKDGVRPISGEKLEDLNKIISAVDRELKYMLVNMDLNNLSLKVGFETKEAAHLIDFRYIGGEMRIIYIGDDAIGACFRS